MNNIINGVGEESAIQNLINDKEWSVRSSMVAQGISLDSLLHNENVDLKSAVRESGCLSSTFENTSTSIARDIVAMRNNSLENY